MTSYVYGPGEWTALAHDGRAALLDPAVDAGDVARIWDSLVQGGSLEAWLEVLTGHGLAALPGFGFVEPGEDGVRVVVRGDVVAHVGGHEVSAGGMRTWREHVAPVGAGVVLQGADSDRAFPLVGGQVLAARIQVGDVEELEGGPGAENEHAATEPTSDAAGASVAVAESAPAEADDAVFLSAADVEPAAQEPDVPGDAQSDVDAPPAAEQPGPADDAGVPEVEEQPGADEPALDPAHEEAAAAAGKQVEPDFVLDDEEDEEEAADGAEAESEWAEAAQGTQMEGLPDGGQAAGEIRPAALQEPWSVPAPPPPQASQWGPPVTGSGGPAGPVPALGGAAADLGDHDGHTIRAADLPAHEHPVDMTLAPHDDERDLAQPVPVALLELSTGQVVELDRPVLIGRAPESSRFTFGETPRLVTVPSPQQDISRTHVEIKLEGDNVLVTDLRSTNGTVVVLPGSPPRRLHPGESMPVPHGTVVDLGDGVTAVVSPPSTTTPLAY